MDSLPSRAARRPGRLMRATTPPLMALAVGGCVQVGAPSFVLFGAFFPAWMMCAAIGIVAAIVARIVFVASGLARILPLQLFVSSSVGVIFGLAAWLSWFGR